jgi:hypothetical protein
MAPALRPGKCLAIAIQESPCSFSRRIFASSSGVYLALLEVEVGLPSSFVDPLLFCLAGQRLFAEETVSRFSVPWYPAPCSAHRPQVNCSMKVGSEPFTVTRLRTAFPRGHSSNVPAGLLSVSASLSKVDSRDDDGWAAPRWHLGRLDGLRASRDMLGRLRMTVDECIDTYSTLSHMGVYNTGSGILAQLSIFQRFRRRSTMLNPCMVRDGARRVRPKPSRVESGVGKAPPACYPTEGRGQR